MAEPVTGTISADGGTVGPFVVRPTGKAQVAIKVDAGSVALQRKLDEATGFINTADAYTTSQTLTGLEPGTYQALGVGATTASVAFVPY